MSLRFFCLFICLAFAPALALGQNNTYKSATIEQLESLSSSLSSKDLGNLSIVTKYDDSGKLSHIGVELFDNDLINGDNEYVYRFIERYFLELLCWNKSSLQQKLEDDDILFFTGIPQGISEINKNMDFNLTLVNDSYYSASWTDHGRDFISFRFPVNYELILGMTQTEMEACLEGELISQVLYDTQPEIPEAEMIESGMFRSIPISHYYFKNLNDCTYYSESDSKELLPVFDVKHPEESAANMFQIAVGDDFKMDICQELYGFKSAHYEIPISQWRSFCKRNKLKTYFAIEKETDSEYLALIICESRDLAYNHLLSVSIPKSFITQKESRLSVKLYAYIPTHNIETLYHQDELIKNEM